MSLSELDRAEIKHDARELYKHVGYAGAIDCMLESLCFVEMLCEVLREEHFHDTL